MSGSREDQYNVTVTVDGVKLGTFDKLSGGSIDSDETKYRPGALAEEISLGGSRSKQNVTVERLYDLDRDAPIVGTLLNRAGKGAVTVSKQSLDVDGNPHGVAIVYKGRLKQTTPPNADSTSNNAGMLALEVSVDSVTTA